jgi:predicted dehydrogenase
VAEVPAPVPGKGQILVRVMASLISAGTERAVVEFAEKNLVRKAMARPDLIRQFVTKAKREGWLATFEAVRNRLDSEMVLGYSNAGIIVNVGAGVIGFEIGDQVACAGGGYASHSEFVRIPYNLAAAVPAGPGLRPVPHEQAAFAAVAAIALHGIRLAELQIGEVVAVIGLGLVGQIVVQLAVANGCTVVGLDPNAERCKLAERMGCIATATSEEEMSVATASYSDARGADAVLIAAATESDGPVTLAAEIARDRARVISVGVVGMSLPRKPYFMKELEFRVSRSCGPGRFDPEYEEKGHDYPAGYVRWTEGRNVGSILQLLASGKLDFGPLITHRFPIEEAERGYDLITGKTTGSPLGVILTYANQPSAARTIQLTRIDEPSLPPSTDVRLGVIGAGNFASAALLPAIRSIGGIKLIGICAGGSSSRSVGERFGFSFCTSDEAVLLSDARINTIAICTRHSLHARQVVDAFRAGKHVFCEKPVAMTEGELASIVEAHHRLDSRRLLAVGFNRRFAPLASHLKAFFSGVAEPFLMHYRVNAGFIAPDHWIQDREQGGGRVLGEVCHFIDLLSFVCGRPVISAQASVVPNSGKYSDDNVAATLRFADGSIGTITYSANGDKSFSKERLEVFCQGRVAVLDDFRELQCVHNGKRKVTKSRLRADKGHRGEWIALSQAIVSGGPPPIPFHELVNSTLATLALARSSSGGLPVEVDSDGFIAAVRSGSYTSGVEEES